MTQSSHSMLHPKPLTKEHFAGFGDVIELADANPIEINDGNCLRYSDLAAINIDDTGKTGISLFDAKAYISPLLLTYVERHPLGSQAFLPTNNDPYLVIVAADNNGEAQAPEVFVTSGYQGVNYYRNTWHGVLTPIESRSLFVVVDYIGKGSNLQEFEYATPYLIDFGSI